MALTSTSYEGDGITASFAIVFDFLKQAHVKVVIGSSLQTLGVDYTISSGNVVFGAPPAAEAAILIQRNTPFELENQIVNFIDGGTITEANLDLFQKQLVYMTQEAIEQASGSSNALAPEYLDVRIFGAQGLGPGTDDYTAIQAALTYASLLGGIQVFFPIPTVSWEISTGLVVLGDNLRVFGSHRDRCLITLQEDTNPGDAMLRIGSSGTPSNGVEIANLTLDGRFSTHTVPASTDAFACIFSQRSNGLRITNVACIEPGLDGIRIGDAATTPESSLPYDTSISRCYIRDAGNYGIRLYGVIRGEIRDCTIERCGDSAVVVAGSVSRPSTSVAVSGIIVDRSSDPAVVNESVLSGVSTGASILVRESLGCSITGCVILDNRPAGGSGISAIGSTDTSIIGNTVRYAGGWGIICPSYGGTVTGNTVSNSNIDGIVVTSGASIDVEHIVVSNNVVTDANEGDVAGKTAGIRVLDFTGAGQNLNSLTIQGNVVRDTRGTKRCDYGIWVDGRFWAICDGISIDGNVCLDVLDEGMHIDDDRNPSQVTNLRIGESNVFPVDEWYGTATLGAGGTWTSPTLAHLPTNLAMRVGVDRVTPGASTGLGFLTVAYDDATPAFTIDSLDSAAAAETGDRSTVQWAVVGTEDAF
jgi:hypothetical protein